MTEASWLHRMPSQLIGEAVRLGTLVQSRPMQSAMRCQAGGSTTIAGASGLDAAVHFIGHFAVEVTSL